MKNPSTFALAAALGLTAAARAQTVVPAGLAPVDAAFMESASPAGPAAAPGVRSLLDMPHNRKFLVNDKSGTVMLLDFTTGKNSAWVSLEKKDDPTVQAYREFLAGNTTQSIDALGPHLLTNSPASIGPRSTAGIFGPSLMFRPANAPSGGQDAPVGGTNLAATGGSGASNGPASIGGSGNLGSPSGLSGSGPSGVDGGTGDPGAFGGSAGRFMASRQSGSNAAGGSGGGLGGGAAAAAQPLFADGGAVADPGSIPLTYKGTVSADKRMHGAENQALDSGALAPVGGASQVPNPDTDSPQPRVFGATTND